MAYVNDHGRPEIIPNGDGQLTTASVVYFFDHDEWVVGEEAVKMIIVDSGNVARYFKRRMGQDGADLQFYGRSYSPMDLQSILLTKLREDAVDLLGSDVKDAVITVPAHFNSAQRAATREAGTRAGLNVCSVLNEPTAAAVAFGLDRVGQDQRFLVFDLGGGTFDVTVMQITGNRLTTIATAGEPNLGGVNWDERLVGGMVTTFHRQFGIDLREHRVAFQELYERCVLAKISLSTKDQAVVPVHCQGKRTVVKITRSRYEKMCADLVDRCGATTDSAIKKARVVPADLHDILMVGGSTRMPMVHQLIRDRFGREPNVHTNPDHTVAYGAALAGVYRHRPSHPALQQIAARPKPRPQATGALPRPQPTQSAVSDKPRGARIGLADGGHIAEQMLLQPSRSLPRFEIQERTGVTLGIVVLDRDHQEQVVPLIAEGTILPAIKRGRFVYAFDGMTAVRVEVTEGSGNNRSDVNVVGKVELTGLPPRPKGTPLEVIYEYGQDQILRVGVIDVETGAEKHGTIRFAGGAKSLPPFVPPPRFRTGSPDAGT